MCSCQKKTTAFLYGGPSDPRRGHGGGCRGGGRRGGSRPARAAGPPAIGHLLNQMGNLLGWPETRLAQNTLHYVNIA